MTRRYDRGGIRAEDANGSPIPGASVTLWDAQTSGAQITTGIIDLDGGAIAGGVLTTDAFGIIPGFIDTMDRADLWAIGNLTGDPIDGVDRVLLEPSDIESRVASAVTVVDGMDGRVTALETAVSGTDGIDDQLTGIDGQLTDLDGQVTSLDGRVTTLEDDAGTGPDIPDPSTTVVAETSYGASSTAGTATEYSRGDHTHGTPALNTLGIPTPAGSGLVAWSYDLMTSESSNQPAAGRIYLVAVYPSTSTSVTTIYWAIEGVSGVSLTASQNKVGLFNSSGTLLQQTDVTSVATTTGLKTTTITSTAVTAGSLYWVGFVFNGTTMPSLARGAGLVASSAAAINVGLSAATLRVCVNGASGNTTLSNRTPSSNTTTNALPWWCAIA